MRVEKLRWLISDIFLILREIDIFTAVKFENVNSIEIKENILKIACFKALFSDREKEELRNILRKNFKVKDIAFIDEAKKLQYPLPVTNSKFNNFITKISIYTDFLKLEFFQKNNNKFYESEFLNYTAPEDLLDKLQDFTDKKLELLERLYRYNQIILPFDFFKNNIDFITEKWQKYIEQPLVKKFVDKIYFYF